MVPHAIQLYVFQSTDNFDHFKDMHSVIFKKVFLEKKIVIDEVSTMGGNMLVQIEKILRKAYGQEDLPYGGFIVIIVGGFQLLPPVGDKPMYTEGNAEAYILLKNVPKTFILKQPQRQVGNSPEELKFQWILQHCQEGSLTEQDWMDLSEQFVGTASGSNDVSWDQDHQVFYDKKSAVEYKI